MPITDISTIDGNRLEIVFNNTAPVALTDFTLSLLAISNDFEEFIEDEMPRDATHVRGELLVKEVRTGSIVIELMAQALPIIPLLWEGGAILEWANYAKDTLMWLVGKTEQPSRNITKHDLKNWHSILEPVAKDNGSQLNFNVTSGGQVVNHFHIGSKEANAAQNKIRREIGIIEEPTDHTFKKRVMTWYQAKFDQQSQTGNRAIIESISPKPLRVIFDNNAVRAQMYEQGLSLKRPWHELAYVVDVQVQTINGVPRVASILNFYPDETFDPSE